MSFVIELTRIFPEKLYSTSAKYRSMYKSITNHIYLVATSTYNPQE